MDIFPILIISLLFSFGVPILLVVIYSFYSSSDKYKRKKLDDTYKIIKNKPYYNDFISIFITTIVISVFMAFVFLHLENDTFKRFDTLIASFFLFWLFTLLTFTRFFSAIRAVKLYIYQKIALKKQNIVPGKIICYCHIIYSSEKSTEHQYYFIISYYDSNDGTEKTFLTPQLSFNTNNTIGSNECNVYIYHDIPFAYDFLSIKDTGKIEDLYEDNSYLQDKSINKKPNYFWASTIISFILALTAHYLRINF